jgi:hypothetical protein
MQKRRAGRIIWREHSSYVLYCLDLSENLSINPNSLSWGSFMCGVIADVLSSATEEPSVALGTL